MLEHIFGSKTRVKLLQLFFRKPEQAFYGREIARSIGNQLNAVRRELANLEAVGLIVVVPASECHTEELGTERSKYYRLNKNFALYGEFKSLLVRAQMMEEQELVEEIKKKAGEMDLVVLSGVFTNEDNAPTDLLLVGEIKPMAMVKLIKKFEKVIGQPLRYTVMERREFNERREIGDRFLYGIFEAANILALDNIGLR